MNCTNQRLQNGYTNEPLPLHPRPYSTSYQSTPAPHYQLTSLTLSNPTRYQNAPHSYTPGPCPLGHLSRAICSNLGHQLLLKRREFLSSSPRRSGGEAPPGFFEEVFARLTWRLQMLFATWSAVYLSIIY